MSPDYDYEREKRHADELTEKLTGCVRSLAPVAGSAMLTRAAKYWRAPFRYWQERSAIVDADGHMILDLRGWGHLTGVGAHNLDGETAAAIQDHVGEHVTKLLTNSWPNK